MSCERYTDAEEMFQLSFLCGGHYLLGHDGPTPDRLRNMDNLASIFNRQGRFTEALDLYKRALASLEVKLRGTNLEALGVSDGTVSITSNIATRMPKETLELHKPGEIPSKSHEGTFIQSIPPVIGTPEGPEELLRVGGEVIGSEERILDEDHTDFLKTFQSIASVLLELGRYGEALSFYERAIAGREKVLGKYHPDTLSAGHSIAFALEGLERYDDARELYENVLAGRAEVLGRKHPDTLTTALYLSKNVLISQEQLLGKGHPDILSTAHNIVYVLNALGRFQEALKLSEQILASHEKLRYLSQIVECDNSLEAPGSSGRSEKATYQEKKLRGEHPYSPAAGNGLASISFRNSSNSEKMAQSDGQIFTSQEKKPKRQNILDIMLFLQKTTSLLNNTIWRIKYMISRLEFEITLALAPPPIGKASTTRVYWECVSKYFLLKSLSCD